MGSISARDESALEPVELIKQSGAVLRVGRAMLTSGTGSYRVKTAMDQVAHAFGLDRHEAHVTLTEITGTSYRGPIFRTEVAEVHSMGVNSNKIKLLTEPVNGLKPGATPDHVVSAVDRIDAASRAAHRDPGGLQPRRQGAVHDAQVRRDPHDRRTRRRPVELNSVTAELLRVGLPRHDQIFPLPPGQTWIQRVHNPGSRPASGYGNSLTEFGIREFVTTRVIDVVDIDAPF